MRIGVIVLVILVVLLAATVAAFLYRLSIVRGGGTAAIMRGRRSLHPGAFKAPLASGNVQVVSRYGAKRVMTQGRYKGKMRQPLAVEYGATVAQMLAKGRRPERLADYAGNKLLEEAERIFDVRYGRKPPTTTG